MYQRNPITSAQVADIELEDAYERLYAPLEPDQHTVQDDFDILHTEHDLNVGQIMEVNY